MHNKINIQDVFLNIIRKEKVSVTIFLVNGVKLQGYIAGFDNFAISLKRDNLLQLVYKHSISTILPGRAINIPLAPDHEDTAQEESSEFKPYEEDKTPPVH